MGATNTTVNYSLSQFIATDKPAWLQDYNGDMLKIDTAIKAAKTAADTAQTTADSASSASGTNATAISSLQTTVTGLNNSVTSIQGSVNTIESLIGNGTPTTTDHTIIGAINEINAYKHLKKIGRVDLSLAATQKAAYDSLYTFLNSQYPNSTISGRLEFSTGSAYELHSSTVASGYVIESINPVSNSVAINVAYLQNGTSSTGYYRFSTSGTFNFTDATTAANTAVWADIYIWE